MQFLVLSQLGASSLFAHSAAGAWAVALVVLCVSGERVLLPFKPVAATVSSQIQLLLRLMPEGVCSLLASRDPEYKTSVRRLVRGLVIFSRVSPPRRSLPTHA